MTSRNTFPYGARLDRYSYFRLVMPGEVFTAGDEYYDGQDWDVRTRTIGEFMAPLCCATRRRVSGKEKDK